MHDIEMIRRDPEAFDAALARRGVRPSADAILSYDEQCRLIASTLQSLRSERNQLSKNVGDALKNGDFSTADRMKKEVERCKNAIAGWEKIYREKSEHLKDAMQYLPNLPAEDVPDGTDENSNVEISRWGKAPVFDFEPREHADFGPALGLDFETGAAMSGARFTFLRGKIARLHRAIGQFMLDYQVNERAYVECAPPLLVRDEAVFGTGQLPKFEDDLFCTYIGADFAAFARECFSSLASTMNIVPLLDEYEHVRTEAAEIQRRERAHFIDVGGGGFKHKIDLLIRLLGDERSALVERVPSSSDRRWLIPTAEVSLTNSVRETILDDLSQPIRLAALTPCFRSEAGAAGRDTRGFIRQHQFEKVEMVTICRPEDWPAEHEHMVASAQGVLEALGLPYRRMLLCAGDMGATAKKTYDLEVWLPGQGAWREISSISWCGDYQARRMNARYRPQGGKGTAFVHTLNGSGLAVGRTLVAVLENCQQADGSVTVPPALAPYMGGLTLLEPAR